MLAAVCLAGPVFAASYPVSGRWGESRGGDEGAVDCAGRRVMDFDGAQRFDSGGGVPEFRATKIVPRNPGTFRITDEFNTGQVNAQITYDLRQIDGDRLELVMNPGGTMTLQRCK